MNQNESPVEQPPLLERITATIGLCLVIALISFTVYRAVTQDPGEPSITTKVLSIEPLKAGYLVKIKAMNNGGKTAAGVKISGQIMENGKELDEAELSFDYVASHSEKTGGLFFTKKPSLANLEIRALGYQEP